MATNKNIYSKEFNEFNSISDFAMRITRGAELCFVWNNKMYVIDGTSPKGVVLRDIILKVEIIDCTL